MAEEPRFERGRAFTVSRAKTWRVTNYTIPQQNGVARGIEPRLLSRKDALPTELEATKNMAGNVGFEPTEPFSPAVFKTAALDLYANSPFGGYTGVRFQSLLQPT